MKLVKLIMPSVGDMEIVKQDGGTLLLKPMYYGGECAGPIVQFVDTDKDGKETALSTYRLKIKDDESVKVLKRD
jgi:hypothetical protein